MICTGNSPPFGRDTNFLLLTCLSVCSYNACKFTSGYLCVIGVTANYFLMGYLMEVMNDVDEVAWVYSFWKAPQWDR